MKKTLTSALLAALAFSSTAAETKFVKKKTSTPCSICEKLKNNKEHSKAHEDKEKAQLVKTKTSTPCSICEKLGETNGHENGHASTEDENKSGASLDDFKLKGSLRMSYEHSSLEGNGKESATALSTRMRLSLETPELAGFSAFVQGQFNVNAHERFDDKRGNGGGEISRDPIADPQGGRVHQAYLQWKGYDTLIRAGRQEIILDDARFIGNIGWRQNAQSLDAILIQNKGIKNLTLSAAWVEKIQSIILTEVEIDHLAILHANYKWTEGHSISFYNYFLDTKGTARDNRTHGFIAKGKEQVFVNDYHDLAFVYELSAAHQDDYKDGVGHNANYFKIFTGLETKSCNFGIGYVEMSGAKDSEGFGFDTLISTAHAHNGWADAFGPNGGNLRNGLRDLYVQAGTKVAGTKLLARVHSYRTSDSNTFDGRYGEEFNLLAVRNFEVAEGHDVKVLAKYAFINGNDTAQSGVSDEQVFWLRAEYSF